jgi:hypothetical protein
VAHTFYNRDQFRSPGFSVTSKRELTMLRAYEHPLAGGAELLLMLWNDKGKVQARIEIGSGAYKYPVRVSTFNYHQWTDVPYELERDSVGIDFEVAPDPTIIRLVRMD